MFHEEGMCLQIPYPLKILYFVMIKEIEQDKIWVHACVMNCVIEYNWNSYTIQLKNYRTQIHAVCYTIQMKIILHE